MQPVHNVEQAFSPLDEQLSLQPGSLTPLQRGHLTHYATLQSFDKAARMLAQHHGVHVSASTSRRQTEDLGAAAEFVQDEQAKAKLASKNSNSDKISKTKEGPKLVVSNDGAYVSLRGNMWAEVKTMAVGEVQENTRPSKLRPNQEVKMTNISYFSRMTTSETFTELIIGELERRGFFDADTVAAIQDGAEWIQSLIAALREDILRILDFYHAGQYLSDIAALVNQAGTQLPAKWWEERLHELKHQGPEKVLEEVLQLLKEHSHVDDLDKKVNYLQKREEMMQYPQFQQQGWPIGSGSVESANVGVVQARMKGVGMHWERKNVNPMLALRVGECNDRWDETREQANRQRLLTRRAQRFARQLARYEELEQNVVKSIMHIFLLVSPAKPMQTHFSTPSPQTGPVTITSSAIEPAKTSIPAKSHPWRRYPHAKK